MRYQFTSTVVVEGVKYEAGAVVSVNDIPAGSLQSCVRVGYLKPIPPEPPKQEAAKQEPPKLQQSAKK